MLSKPFRSMLLNAILKSNTKLCNTNSLILILNYANRKSLFTLSICSSRFQAVATCPIKSRVTISHLIGQRSIASRTFEIADNYHSLL